MQGKKEKFSTTKKSSNLIIIGFGVLFVVIVGLVFWYIFSVQGPISPIATNQPTPLPTLDVKQPKNIVLLGYGGGTHDGGLLTDTIIVARIIPKDQKIILISLPRDMWVSMKLSESDTQETKINAAYAIGNDDSNYPNKAQQYTGKKGGGTLAKEIVGQVIGMPVDAYISISFTGFVDAMKLLGPITVAVPFSFTDSYYPIEGKENESCGKSEDDIRSLTASMSGFELEKLFACRYEVLTFTKGNQTLDPQTALKFVRSRHSDEYGNDFGRSQRQQAFLKAVKSSIFSLGTIPKIIPLLQKGFSIVDTDISFDFVKNALRVWSNFPEYEVSSIALTDQNILVSATSADGQYILQPKSGANDWQSIATFIQQEIASPSAAVHGR